MSKKAGSDYTHVLLKSVPRDQEDELSSFCFQNGADGVCENLHFEQPELRYEPSVVIHDSCDLNVYFVNPPTADFFTALKREFAGVVVETSVEPNKDWLEEWKKGFEPFVFADPFWIIPSWREAPPEALEKIFVDPGMAFGTGTHETTQLAARFARGALGDDVRFSQIGDGRRYRYRHTRHRERTFGRNPGRCDRHRS